VLAFFTLFIIIIVIIIIIRSSSSSSSSIVSSVLFSTHIPIHNNVTNCQATIQMLCLRDTDARLLSHAKAGNVLNATDVFHGLLLPSDVERRSSGVRSAGQHNGTASEHKDVGRNLETGHILPQRTRILPAHHHLLQQTVSYQHHRRYSLLAAVKSHILPDRAPIKDVRAQEGEGVKARVESNEDKGEGLSVSGRPHS